MDAKMNEKEFVLWLEGYLDGVLISDKNPSLQAIHAKLKTTKLVGEKSKQLIVERPSTYTYSPSTFTTTTIS